MSRACSKVQKSEVRWSIANFDMPSQMDSRSLVTSCIALAPVSAHGAFQTLVHHGTSRKPAGLRKPCLQGIAHFQRKADVSTAREYTMLKLEDRVDPEGTRSVMETAQKYDDRGFEKKPLATLNSPQKRKQRLIGEMLPTQLSHKLCSMTI